MDIQDLEERLLVGEDSAHQSHTDEMLTEVPDSQLEARRESKWRKLH